MMDVASPGMKLTKGLNPTIRLMRECRATGNKNSPHQWMLMVISVQSTGVIDSSRRNGLLQIHFALLHKGPSCLGDKPQGSDALVAREVISLRHVDIAEIDVHIWVCFGLLDQVIVDGLGVGGVFRSQPECGRLSP